MAGAGTVDLRVMSVQVNVRSGWCETAFVLLKRLVLIALVGASGRLTVLLGGSGVDIALTSPADCAALFDRVRSDADESRWTPR
jgi:hypothetical protein